MLQQRRLPDAGFAAQHEGAAVPGVCLREQVLDGRALRAPAQEITQLCSRIIPFAPE
ncbi:hypothetical protein GCM10009613_54760 [Pseudonocardia kongjuensis]|uniref:Uncharacterized protein n=1 Tax=Pseudonocardia kongjuensis TaxID=102227 RepID=A0ABN1Y6N9_9PSEU